MKNYIVLLLFVIFPDVGIAQTNSFYPYLDEIRNLYQEKDTNVVKIISKYRDKANNLLYSKNLSVINKDQIPPSGDKRDFFSMSTYWWPDKSKKDGLPYIRRDGVTNPDIYKIPDKQSLNKIAESSELLCVMYYLTNDSKYSKKAAELLRSWFIDSKTGMNPNMCYSQVVLGINKLRGTGIIDARCIIRALNASSLIETSKYWSAHDKAELNELAEAYNYWLEHSYQGQYEHDAQNNHGVWYDTQHLGVLLYLNKKDKIKYCIENDLINRLDKQISSNGSLPKEMERTRSLHYHTFLVEALLQANKAAKSVGIDLWTEKTKSGKKISSIINFLYPYYKDPSLWKKKDVVIFDVYRASPILYEVGKSINEPSYIKLALHIGIDKNNDDLNLLPYITLMK